MEKRTIVIGFSLLAVVGLGIWWHSKSSANVVVQNNKSKPSPPTIVNTPSGAAIDLGATDSDKAYLLDLKKQGYTDQQIAVMYAKRKGLIK